MSCTNSGASRSVGIEELTQGFRTTLGGYGGAPVLEVVSAGIRTTNVPTKLLDQRLPGWRELGQGLVVPGLRDCVGLPRDSVDGQ